MLLQVLTTGMTCWGKLSPVLSTVIYCFRGLNGNFELQKYKIIFIFLKILIKNVHLTENMWKKCRRKADEGESHYITVSTLAG